MYMFTLLHLLYYIFTDKEGYSKIEGADFDHQMNQGLTRYGHMIKEHIHDITTISGTTKHSKADSTSSFTSANFDTEKLLADSLDDKYSKKYKGHSSKGNLENSGSSTAESAEYLNPSVPALSKTPQQNTSLFEKYPDSHTGASLVAQSSESTTGVHSQSHLPEEQDTCQSKKIKPIRVKAVLHNFSSDEDQEKSNVENVVRELGAEQYTYIKRNGRKVIVIKDRGGTSFLFLGKNRLK